MGAEVGEGGERGWGGRWNLGSGGVGGGGCVWIDDGVTALSGARRVAGLSGRSYKAQSSMSEDLAPNCRF